MGIMDVLQWIIPSGAIASVITWLVNRSLHNARSAKEQQDIYKTMYENLHETVLNIQNDYKKITISLIQLEKAVSKANLCKYYDTYCPVRVELQNAKGEHTTKPIGLSPDKRNKKRFPRSGTTEQGIDDNDTTEPSGATCGIRIYPQGRTGQPENN